MVEDAGAPGKAQCRDRLTRESDQSLEIIEGLRQKVLDMSTWRTKWPKRRPRQRDADDEEDPPNQMAVTAVNSNKWKLV
jgi:hypothetical protein